MGKSRRMRSWGNTLGGGGKYTLQYIILKKAWGRGPTFPASRTKCLFFEVDLKLPTASWTRDFTARVVLQSLFVHLPCGVGKRRGGGICGCLFDLRYRDASGYGERG